LRDIWKLNNSKIHSIEIYYVYKYINILCKCTNVYITYDNDNCNYNYMALRINQVQYKFAVRAERRFWCDNFILKLICLKID